VAGHRGLVGSAIVRNLRARGYSEQSLLTRSRSELDLGDARAVDAFFEEHRPSHVYLAAAKVGGIHANNSVPADFIRENLTVQTNVIDAAYRYAVDRLLFLGSSCIYPKLAPQPLTEESLLTGPLEPTNRPYAIAKIAGIEMCWSYNRQHGTKFLAVMPTNLYGPGDHYHGETSHVIPALIRRFHEAKVGAAKRVAIWGTGTPRREFMYVDDMANACIHLMTLPPEKYEPLLARDRNDGLAPVVNIGVGSDVTIAEVARLIAKTVGYAGEIEFDLTKPDGTPRKLLDCRRLNALGWQASTPLAVGLVAAYDEFKARCA
jgi:GDP-L-fucose synthase